MKGNAGILVWLIVCLVLNAGCLSTPDQPSAPENLTAQAIAAEFIRHNANLSGYSAMVHTMGESGYEDDEYRFFAQRPDKFRAEYIRSDIHGNGTIVVANGTFVWQYHPDTRTAEPDLIENHNNTFFASKDYPAIAARILGKFPAVLNGTDIPDGSTAVILEAVIDDIPTQYYPTIFRRIRVWIDEDSLMMTRMEMIGEYNETALTVELRNIHINPPLSEELFDFTPPPGTDISPTVEELVTPVNASSMRQAKERFGPDFMLPAYFPSGYTFRYCLHYRDGRDSIVYSSGTDNIIFTQALQGNNASFATPAVQEIVIHIGNRTGTFWSESAQNHIRWNQRNGTYELAGAMTKDDLFRIAQSLEVPALLNFAPGEIKDPETIAAIALRDTSARRMVDAGGEILGVGMSIKRSTKTVQGGIYPALLIRYNGLLADFMVDPDAQKPVGRTIQVPNNAMVRHVGDQTVVEYNGEILFTFDPVEGNP